MKIIQMSPAQWAKVQSNPIQRDTEAHAKKATRGHLRAASSSQMVVHAAELPGGAIVKLDGHTRSLLWSDGRLPAPAVVHVVLHEVDSMATAMNLYKEFDNSAATENAGDRLSGAFRLHGIVPIGRILSHGAITTALACIDPSKTIYELVGEWKTELILLDEIEATSNAMPSTLICAALMTLRRHGKKALDFWNLYAAGRGTRIDGKSCGVDELTRIVNMLRAKKMLATGMPSQRRAQAGRAISCCEAWLQGRMYSEKAKTTDFCNYLKSMSDK